MRGQLAAEKLDSLWDGWTKKLSGSYSKTLRHMEAGKTGEASATFHEVFVTEVKEVYSEAACTTPKRFVKSKDWAAWLRRVYALSIKTDSLLRKACNAGESVEARDKARKDAEKSLAALRRQFHVLHTSTNTLKANDYIYGFYEEAMKETPAIDKLRSLRAGLDKADPSANAKANAKAFQRAKAKWIAGVDPILADNSIRASEIETLRKTTGRFHRAFGEPFE